MPSSATPLPKATTTTRRRTASHSPPRERVSSVKARAITPCARGRRQCSDSSVPRNRQDRHTTSLPVLSKKDIEIGKLLGSGGFTEVFEVYSSYKFQPRFVIKKLERNVTSDQPKDCDPELFERYVADLKNEGQILASLNGRDDIVSICGWTFGRDEKETPATQCHFLVLERLDETLGKRLSDWRAKERHESYHVRSPGTITAHRASIVLALVEAVRHIHSRRILHRDLKPGNVGFQSGTLKLFDFGLARILRVSRKVDFRLTGKVGTLRYMSPECGRGERYGLPADVYSFGVMCFEVLTLREAFPSVRNESLEADKAAMERIWDSGDRPNLSSLPEAFANVLHGCWDNDPIARPSMEEAQRQLTAALSRTQRRQKVSLNISRVSSKTKSLWNKINKSSLSPVIKRTEKR